MQITLDKIYEYLLGLHCKVTSNQSTIWLLEYDTLELLDSYAYWTLNICSEHLRATWRPVIVWRQRNKGNIMLFACLKNTDANV